MGDYSRYRITLLVICLIVPTLTFKLGILIRSEMRFSLAICKNMHFRKKIKKYTLIFIKHETITKLLYERVLRFYLLPVSLWTPAPSGEAYRCHKVICREILNWIYPHSHETNADQCTITNTSRIEQLFSSIRIIFNRRGIYWFSAIHSKIL